jgi:hypothetical protein
VASRDVADIDRETRLSQGTGGFDLKKLEQKTATSLTAILKERNRSGFARATMEVHTHPPHRVVHFQINPIPPPDEFLTADQRARSTVDNAKSRRLVEGIAREIEAPYVFPEVGQRMIVALRDHAARGHYDNIPQADVLSAAITKDLRDVSHDLHLRVFFGPTRPLPSQRPRDERLAESRRINFGFGPIDRLPGNVAHLVINGFVPAAAAVREAIAGFMTRVADADALLVDLRENHGGDPATVALIASYLFDSTPVHLNDMYRRDDGSTRQFWTLRDLPGKRLGSKKPVYVLTSKQTFSGGEELAYDLQCLRRALVVGETTGGGANPAAPHDLGDGFRIAVPWGRPINPITKTNWEQVGVIPDVKVPAPAALEEARLRALADINAKKASAPGSHRGEPPVSRR